MLFTDVAGQQSAKDELIRKWGDNKFPHALLLLGQEGRGGLPMALALAQFLFCEQRTAHDACGHCRNCTRVARLEHPDLHLTFPTIPPSSGKKAMSRYFIDEFRKFIHHHPYGTTYDWLQSIQAENKQGNITAEECNEIIETLNLKSYEEGFKVQMIWRIEYLGKIGNKLLKLIEEPTPRTYIIMVAEQAEDVLPTILSRTQIIRLSPLSPAEITTALVAKGVESAEALRVANMAMGSYADALHLLKKNDDNLLEDVRKLFNAVFRDNGLEIADFAEQWSKKGREAQKKLLQYTLHLLEQSVRARYLPPEKVALPPDEAIFVRRVADNKNLRETTMQKMITALQTTSQHIEHNAHSKAQLHAMCIQLCRFVKQ
jgi:DNA polymerase III subunit delta'